jgi:hypothetical protein
VVKNTILRESCSPFGGNTAASMDSLPAPREEEAPVAMPPGGSLTDQMAVVGWKMPIKIWPARLFEEADYALVAGSCRSFPQDSSNVFSFMR